MGYAKLFKIPSLNIVLRNTGTLFTHLSMLEIMHCNVFREDSDFMDEFTISLIIIVICVLLIIFVIKRRAKKEGVTFTQALLRTLMETPQERKAKKRRKDSRMTPQQDAMSDYPWKRDPWKQAEKQKAQSGRKDSRSISGIEKICYILVLLGFAWYGLSVYGGSDSYTNGTNNGSSNTRYANGVTVNNVKEYFGYGSETEVVDCSNYGST